MNRKAHNNTAVALVTALIGIIQKDATPAVSGPAFAKLLPLLLGDATAEDLQDTLTMLTGIAAVALLTAWPDDPTAVLRGIAEAQQ
jgi:hypothetical protein